VQTNAGFVDLTPSGAIDVRKRGRSVVALIAGAALLIIIGISVVWTFPARQFLPDLVGLSNAEIRQFFGRDYVWQTVPLRDFGSFVAAAQLVAAENNPYGDHPLVFRPVFPGGDGSYTVSPNLNPPLLVMLFQPLAWANPMTAYRAWYAISLGLYGVALWLLWRLHPTTVTPLRVLWAIALAGLWHVMELGQIYMPLLLATIGAWLLLERGRQAWAGLLIGLVVAAKPTFVLWPLLLLLGGSWITGLTALATGALVSLIPAVYFGPAIYEQWLQATAVYSPALLPGPGNSSLIGLAARLGAPALGIAASAVLVVTVAVWLRRRRPPVLVASEVGLLIAMLVGPLTWAGYTLLLLPALLSRPWSAGERVAAVLLVVPFLAVLRLSGVSPALNIAVGGLYCWALLILLGAALRTGWRLPAPATPSASHIARDVGN
jgi:hypothetical protein